MSSPSSQNGLSGSAKKLNINQLIAQAFHFWYVFVIAAVLGLTAAYLYNRYFPKSYKVSSVFVLKNQPHQMEIATNLEDLNVQERSPKVQNELAVLSSYRLQVKTLQNLKWIASWSTNGILSRRDLYHEEPFLVSNAILDSQQQEVPLNIKVISDTSYIVSCDFHSAPPAVPLNIRFNQNGSFGRTFQNEFFHFILNRIQGKPPIPGGEYKLRFNNLNQMAIDYQGRLEVKTTVTESDVLTAELKGPNAERVVDYLNALGIAYVEFGLEEKNRIASNKLKFIREQIMGLSDSLKNSGNRFTSFRSRNKIVDLGQEGTQTLKRVEDVALQENTLKARIDYYINLKKNLSEGGQIKNVVAPAEANLTDPTINTLSLKLNDLLTKKDALSNIVQAENPKMIAANKEIEFTQKLIAGNVENLLAITQGELQKLNVEKASVNSQLSEIPKTERTLLGFKRDFDINSQLYNYLLQKSAEAAIALASNDPDVQILDMATIENTEMVGFKSSVNLLIGLVSALLLSSAFIVLKEYNTSKLKVTDYVSGKLDLSVAGTIPHYAFGSEIPVLKQPYSQVTEAFRNIRSTIKFLIHDLKGKVIAIHSPVHGEGKSFIAINLASIMAMGGKNILLIEADFRNPRLYRTLGINNDKGLSEYLGRKLSLNDIEKKTHINGLSFISAGKKDPRLSEMITSNQLSDLITEARKKYDCIVIDNAPFQLVSDAKIFASLADINLFVLKMNYSSEEELKFINKTAKEEIVRNMAVILNDVTENKKNNKQKAGYFDEEEYPQSSHHPH